MQGVLCVLLGAMFKAIAASGSAAESPQGEPLPRLAATFNHPAFAACTAEKCIDNDYDTNPAVQCGASTSMCHTANKVSDVALEIDLGSTYDVGSVAIYNRIDCCQERLGNFEVWVSASGTVRETLCASGSYVDNINPTVVQCVGASTTGRYVSLLLPGPNREFNIMELYAYGRPQNGAVVEMTGTAPKILFGDPGSPICELSLDSINQELKSTCAISTSSRRHLLDDGCSECRSELKALKSEVDELRRKLDNIITFNASSSDAPSMTAAGETHALELIAMEEE